MSNPPRVEPAKSRPAAAASAAWVRQINSLVRAQLNPRGTGRAVQARAAVLICEPGPGLAIGAEAIRFSGTAAEAIVRQGLKAPLLAELAGAAGIEVRHLYEFAGIDRTTVSRRAARDDVLPQEVSVKAMEFADLIVAAVDVFGAVAAASGWLTKPHPLLDGETPMQRARTPWGLARVRSMLGALKYGGAV